MILVLRVTAILILLPTLLRAETLRVAAYNVENYLDQPTQSRPHPKSAEAKAKIRESIQALKPDVIALQEIGTTNALLELRDSLKAGGLDLPYWDHVTGFDTNIHVAVLSRFPFTARRPHTKESFLLSGRRFRVSRGFAEADIKVNADYSFTLITAHLKSKRPVGEADEAGEHEDGEVGDQHQAAAPAACLAPSWTISPPRVTQAPAMISSSKSRLRAPSSPVISSSSDWMLRA
jgi:hypothetical protein